ncbi:hypothetical protein ACFLYO_09740 [Chloroflexota bacterium]
MMKVLYTGPVKTIFGLQLKSGDRVMVDPGKPLVIEEQDGRHVLRRWPGLFIEQPAPVSVEEVQPTRKRERKAASHQE